MIENVETYLYKKYHENYIERPSIKIGYQTFHIDKNEPLSITRPKGPGYWKLVEEDKIGILTIEWVNGG